MEKSTFYIIKNAKTNEVWSGYKWKKGTWQKAMLYKSTATINSKIAELACRGYDCVVMRLEVTIEEY